MQPSPLSSSKAFSSPQKETPYPLSSHPSFSYQPQPLATTGLLDISMDLPTFWVFQIKGIIQGFPGGTVVESLAADSGDTGSCPGPGGSHMLRSGWAREPWPLSLRVRSLCSATGEATTVRGPRTAKNNKKKMYSLLVFKHWQLTYTFFKTLWAKQNISADQI